MFNGSYRVYMEKKVFQKITECSAVAAFPLSEINSSFRIYSTSLKINPKISILFEENKAPIFFPQRDYKKKRYMPNKDG